jgi:hypothetical protein
MGRIGPDGAIFPIGKQTAIRTGRQGGKLYLHINPAGGGERVSGGYKVRATTGVGVAAENRIPDSSTAMLLALRMEIAALRDELLRKQMLQEMIRPPQPPVLRPFEKTMPKTIGIN